ncbi:REP-associated tyrosine transposase [Vannielia litorea]|uniref:REP-associated tyrosine transposase n=1 Tax=Vannielia litorea TaxID=1217970 RepID=UPI001BCE3311|nr:transposase [Vannielia litorea]MBS8227168.1 transposase [Vannielia litorea]
MPRETRPLPATAPVFFTVRLAERGSSLLIDGLAVLRDAVRHVKSYRPFDILAFVVLPDHLHAVLRFPEDDPNAAQRWGNIKARFTRDARRAGLVPPWPTADAEGQRGLFPKGRAGIWKKGLRQHVCTDDDDVDHLIHFCWADPVRHGLAARPEDWAASSYHREVRAGKVRAGWLGDGMMLRRGEKAA